LVRSFRSALTGVGAALLLAALFLVAPAAYAQQGGTVHEVVVQGNQRIEAETVRTYLSITEGDAFDDIKIDKSLKALYATGLFADVSLRREGDSLVIKVVENPIVNRVAFEGNKRVKSDQLTTEVQLRPRTVYTRTKVQNDVKRILEIYRRNGRFAVTVEPKLIQLEQNRVDVVYEINEGPSTYVTRIDFLGNKEYTDSALREIMQTKEERWYRFLTSDDTYDPDRVAYDRELLRRFYMKNGYADFRVVSTVAQLTPEREKFFITFTLEEGERYRLGNVEVKSSIPDLKVEELKALVGLSPDDWYNADDVENTVQMLTDAVGTKGYAFVDIKPVLTRHREQHTIDLTFDVQEGPRVFVERIDIQGNVRTLDKVIRREFRLVEGDAFNTAKLRRSRERIKDLDFFEKVEVNNVASETAPDRTVIKVDVTEKSTGELSFGVGWSSSYGALINVGAKERNLLGRGQELSINGTLAQRETSISAGFTEPYFLDRQLAAGVDLFAVTSSQLQSAAAFDSSTTGFDLRTAYYYNEYLRHDWPYTASVTRVDNVDSTASLYIQDEEGTNTLSMIGHTVTWDHRDSRVDPTRGYIMRFGNDVAGVGGSQHFVRNTVGAGQYFKVTDSTVLHLAVNGGYMTAFSGDQVRINERYFLGGDNLRGFKDAGVSPRDITTQDALGGLWQYYGTTEMMFPLGLPKEMGVQGRLFSDFGSIGPTDRTVPKSSVAESQLVRVSVGTGIVWRSPMGPINVDLGFPIVRSSDDKDEIFRLNFGTRF
jgi:outer membrane protein insertion porin family